MPASLQKTHRINLELAVLAKLLEGHRLTLREIAWLLGIGKESIRKIEQAALMKLRNRIDPELRLELAGKS